MALIYTKALIEIARYKTGCLQIGAQQTARELG
jgi:hypothetical protein